MIASEAPLEKAVVLLSGGIDSSTSLAIAKHNGFEPYAISFDYGQRHVCELESARLVARSLGVAHHLVVALNLRAMGGSALTDTIEVPKGRTAKEMGDGVPVTYIPARNTIFLSLALGWAEVLGAFDIFIGANAIDYSGYPDCRPEYLEAFERLANLATKAGVEGKGPFRIHAPLLRMTKAEIILVGTALGVDYGLTHSCYDPGAKGAPCGQCDSCLLRKKGFEGAGAPDPGRDGLLQKGSH